MKLFITFLAIFSLLFPPLPQRGGQVIISPAPSGGGTPFSQPPHSKCFSNIGSGAVNSISCTLSTVSVGDLIPVWAHFNGATPTNLVISDTFGSNFGALLSGSTTPVDTALANPYIVDYFAVSVGSGSDTVTATWTGTALQFNFLDALDYPVSPTPTLDDHQIFSGFVSTGGNAATPNLTTTASGDLLVMVCYGGTLTAGSGYTIQSTSAGAVEDQIAGSAGSYTAIEVFTGSSGQVQCLAMGLKK